jgi:signal transduction histidine kinase
MRLFPHGLTSRLALTYMLLVLLSVGGLIVWAGLQLQTATFEQQERNLEIQAQLIANALRNEFGDDADKIQVAALRSALQTYAQESGLYASDELARVTLVDDKLRVLASSDPRVTEGVEHNHTEFVAARAGYEQNEIRWDEFAKQERVFVAAALRGEHDVDAFVQLSMSTAPINTMVRQMWLGLASVGGIILALTALVSVMLARSIARPVRRLTATSEAIAQGHLEQRVTPEGPDEIERLGRAFNQMTERLSELLMREKEFAGNAAHELRSPLTGLRLRLELLQDTARTNPTVTQNYLAQMEQEVAHLQRVVEQMLALAALEQGKLAPRANFDPAPLLYDLADDISPLVQTTQVEFQVQVPEHLPLIHANAEQVRMAVRNVLENAFKYTPPHGTVILRANALPDVVEIVISDTGVGIPPEALPHIFDRFYRVDTARRNLVRGSGLGLALTRLIVQANAGQIAVTSAQGQGSTFTIQLPRSRA